jgi:competence protein ComEC
MGDLTQRPLVCVALAFAGGIAVASAAGGVALWSLGAAVAVATLASSRARWRSLLSLALLLGAGVAGGLVFQVHQSLAASNVSHLPEGGQTIVGTVTSPPSHSHGTFRFVLASEFHEGGAGPEPITGRVYVRLTSDAPVQRGERWRLTGKLRPLREAANPGQRSEAHRLASLGVSSILTVGSPALAELLRDGDLGPVSTHAFRAQQRALSTLSKNMPGPYREQTAGVAASVIFGVHASPPPREITAVFRRAGTIHLLVVSGAMVSMVFGLVFLPSALGAAWRRVQFERQFSRLGGHGRGRIPFRPGPVVATLAVLVVAYYAVLTEGGQAVLRAAVMGGLVGVALALRRVPTVARDHGLNVDRYTLLAAAALAVLAVTPDALFQPGFQLSFAAVLAILYVTPKAIWLVAWLPKWLGYAVIGTIAAQLATFPILAYHYGQAPIAGFGANLFAIPLAAVVLTSGMATCVLGVLLPWLAPMAGWICAHATRALVWISATFASLPWATIDIPRPSILAVMAWYAAVLVLGVVLAEEHKEPPSSPSN